MIVRRFTRNVRLGIKTLLAHKLRSVLTMLGVVFGVASVVAMLAVGEGASKEALERIRMLGSNNIIITSQKPSSEEGSGTVRRRMSIYGLTYADERRILETMPSVTRTVPAKIVRKEARVEDRTIELRVLGTTQDWFDLVDRDVIAGRTLIERDLDGPVSPVVLTEYGVRRLLWTKGSVGEVIRLGDAYFEVVGIIRSSVAAADVQTPDQEIDAYIPLHVAKEKFGDINVQRTSGSVDREKVELHQIIVQVEDLDQVQASASAIDHMLKTFHPKGDYKMSVPLELLRQAEATKRTFNIVLGSIAGISLLVGGIGIMNIMLASVTERTREIGIRRAIGAKRSQIIGQFLIETVVLSMCGGVIGIVIGVGIPTAIEAFTDMNTVVTPMSVSLSLVISIGIGIVFGIYPAARAANLDPIVALRHE